MKKRIVIDGVIFGLQRAGGISRVWAEILLHLEQSFASIHDIFLLVPTNSNVECQELLPQLKNIKVIKRKRFRWGKRGFFRDSFYLSRIALKLKPHIWHSSYYVGFPFVPNCHKVITYHDMIPEVLNEAIPYETKLKYLSINGSDTCIAISEHSQSDLCRFWPQFKEKICVIYNYTREVEKREALKECPYFLFVGKRRGYKNFFPTITAILSDHRFDAFDIIVAGGEELDPEEKELFQQEKRIQYLGILPYPQIQELMGGASVLLFPSLYEGFGIPLLEAFSAGVPVLAYRSSSIPEVVGPEYPLVDTNVVETLQQLLNEKEKWSQYGQERYKRFSKDKTVEALVNFYQRTS